LKIGLGKTVKTYVNNFNISSQIHETSAKNTTNRSSFFKSSLHIQQLNIKA